MKKILAIFLTLAAFAGMAQAENMVTRHALVVNAKNGEKIVYKFAEIAGSSIEGEDLAIVAGEDVVTHPLADLSHLSFETYETSGVGELPANTAFEVEITREALLFRGLEAGAKVKAFSIDGRLAATGTADAQGCLTLSTTGLADGVYVVAAANHSFKFKK